MLTIYLVLVAVISQFKIYTPDLLLSYSIPYKISTIGSPGLYPALGTIFEMSSLDCSFGSYVLNNFIPILKKPENCSYSQLSSSAEKQGVPFIIFLTDTEEYIQDFYFKTQISIPVLSILEETYTYNLGNYSSMLISYEYKVEYMASPSIEVKLVGGFNNRLMFIKSLIDLNERLDYDFTNFSVNFLYNLFDNTIYESKTDCITYNGQLYCDKGELPGAELLNNSIVSLNIYNEIPKNSQSILQYLTYLHTLYSDCTESPIAPCHQKILEKFQFTYNESYNTLPSFSLFTSNFSHFLINTQLFPWPSHLIQAFCLSSNSVHPSCPLCSPACNISSYFSESCIDNCNSSTCGYSNLLCLSYTGDPLCLNSMINDGICSTHCMFEEDCRESSKKKNNNKKFEVFFIVLCIIIPAFLLIAM